MQNEQTGPEERQLARVEDLNLDETQLAEQLYNSAGLNPVVEAGLKDYDKRLQQEDKMITKVFGPRGSDIKGYGEAVAKRVALAVYGQLNRQYGGQVGDMRSYILQLEDERNRANIRYDELMGRVVGILGEEYKDLRTDSKEFMEKLTTVMGEDAKQARIDQAALAERLADIDGLREQVKTLNDEKEQLRGQIAERDARIAALESEKTALNSELARVNELHKRLDSTVAGLGTTVPAEQIGESLKDELHTFVLKDSKVPGAVIDGVGKFIDFGKYMRIAATRGAEEATKRSEQTLRNVMGS